MTTHSKIVSDRLNPTEETVARAADAINKLTAAITAQSENVGRLERGISKLVGNSRPLSDNIALMTEENKAQHETVDNLIKPATVLVRQRAS